MFNCFMLNQNESLRISNDLNSFLYIQLFFRLNEKEI